jgi:hypothetical protein
MVEAGLKLKWRGDLLGRFLQEKCFGEQATFSAVMIAPANRSLPSRCSSMFYWLKLLVHPSSH